jgi:hypothetical protein
MSTTITPAVFSFMTELKLYDFEEHILYTMFPNAETVTMVSKDYDEISDVAAAAQKFCNSLMTIANQNVKSDRYRAVAEVNPEISGKRGLTDDWEENEVSKIWIISHEGPLDTITDVTKTAISLTTIVKTRGEQTLFLN